MYQIHTIIRSVGTHGADEILLEKSSEKLTDKIFKMSIQVAKLLKGLIIGPAG